MNKRELIIWILSILMIILVPILISGFNFTLIAFDRNTYKEEFSKHNVYTKLNNHDVEKINDEVLNYLASEDDGLIENDFFNAREKAHLLDVKLLVQSFLSIYYFSIILFLSLLAILFLLINLDFRRIFKKLSAIIIFGSLLTFFDAALIYILSNFNFDFAFDAFHKTFFSPGTYLFNPEFEGIVLLYPSNLFLDLLVRVIFSVIFSSVILLFFSLILFFIFSSEIFKIFSEKFPSKNPKKQKL